MSSVPQPQARTPCSLDPVFQALLIPRRSFVNSAPSNGGDAVPELKFCGLTRAEDVVEAGKLGADYVGVIFAGGPRHQTMLSAQTILFEFPRPPKRVLVVADQTPIEIAGFVYAIRADVVQLHADPSPERIQQVKKETAADVWAVLRISGSDLPANFDAIAKVADGIVLDAKTPSGLGGSG